MNKRAVACVVLVSLAVVMGQFAVQNLAAPGPEPGSKEAVQDLLSRGRNLTADQASALEAAVKRKPDDVESRIKLLAYSHSRQGSREAREARQANVLWLVENQPRNPVFGSPDAHLIDAQDGDAYYLAKTLWVKHAEANPEDTAILGNAAAFLLLGRKDEAQGYLERCVRLEPENEAWHEKLADLIGLEMNGAAGAERKQLAAQALKEYEQARKLSRDDFETGSLLIDLAKTSFEAGEYEKARGYAAEILDGVERDREGFDTGNAIHDGNLVLGRLALVSGDVPAARRHLLAAGKTPGAPNLNSFGPNMLLAKELLERGETATVLEYFDLCAKFWTYEQGAKLKAWKKAAQAGIMPDFQGNLYY